MKKFKFTVEENEANTRLDKFLAEKFLPIKPEITRTKIQNLISNNCVFDAAGSPISNLSQKVKIGAEFSVTLPEIEAMHLEAKEISFEIIFEDDDLLVINKPAGLTVHPGAGNRSDTLVNGLLFTHKNNLSQINGEFRPGIVHRLDKDTSGLMLVAKNDFTHHFLSQKLKDREIKRSYLAFIYGALSPQKGVINKNIVRSRTNRLKMSITKSEGRSAITNYETKATFCGGFASLVKCRLQTGRTHQIRVHLEHAKHSIIGDQTYNSSKKTFPVNFAEDKKEFIKNFPRQALHSYEISFLHPRTSEEMSFEIPLPADLQALEKCLS